MNNEISTETTPIDPSVSINPTSELFDDLMIDLHVEVGRVKMKISDLMKMSHGEIIQLDEKSNDPLIIYANDKPIAKGTIVSSNGKYNIRII